MDRLRLLKVWAGDLSYERITDRINKVWSAAGRPSGELATKTTAVRASLLRRPVATDGTSGVAVWLSELGGPVDIHDPMHLSLLNLLGVHAKREVQRARFRAKAAMQFQVTEQGRTIGGQPPYGYLIVDAGPHPNQAQARWGRRLHRYTPDPVAAPWVSWMFTQRLAGWSMAAITVNLDEQGVPCPSAHDPDRNPHRSGLAWTLRTVASILGNPRYTGRQVWNRQHTDHGRLDQANDPLGNAKVYQWSKVQ